MKQLNLIAEDSDNDEGFQSFYRCSEQLDALCKRMASAESRMKRLVDLFTSSGASFINNNYYYYGSSVPQPPAPTPPDFDYTDILNSAPALRIKQSLKDNKMIDDSWQCIRLSCTEISLLAKAVCDRLDIKDVWQLFGQLWHKKPATLRSYFNKALEQKKSLEFQDRLLDILGPISAY
ncbi:MAG: hypothetical protein J6W99_03660 [Bacteroidaceae bacterium]|nr:hypothetical protein [Bacteroidaceae bacterium]